MEFSRRMDHFGPGIFAQLARMKRDRLAQGLAVIDFSVGSPNIPPARHIVEALRQGVQEMDSYVYAIGDTPELRNAVSEWYRRRYGVEIDGENEMMSLLGSQDGLSHLALAVTDPGDLVLVPDPCYPIFADGPLLAGAKLYRMPQTEENGWIVDLKAVPEQVARRAKLMVVSYPNNPVTSIAPPSFYRELVDFARTYGIIVLHDNAYSELTFDGVECGSFLQTPGAKDVGIEFNSLSKTYGLAGARIGFALGNREIIAAFRALKSNMDYGMFLPVQKAAVAALTGPQDCVEETRRAYQRRRDVLVGGLDAAGWHIEKPKATMFVWAKIPAPYTDSAAFTRGLFERTGVLVTPGAAFGPSGEGHVRMALVRSEEEMKDAVKAIEKSGILKGAGASD